MKSIVLFAEGYAVYARCNSVYIDACAEMYQLMVAEGKFVWGE